MKSRARFTSAAETAFVGIPVVVDGAVLECNKGTKRSILKVTHSSEVVENKLVATESDYVFGTNIFPFDDCKANGNKPCTAAFAQPWFGAFSGGPVSGLTKTRHLNLNCRLSCSAFHGIVTIIDSCQSTVFVGDPDPTWTEAVARLNEELFVVTFALQQLYGVESYRRQQEGEMSPAEHLSAIYDAAADAAATGSLVVPPVTIEGEVVAGVLKTASVGFDIVDWISRKEDKHLINKFINEFEEKKKSLMEQLRGYGALNEKEDEPRADPIR